MWAEPSARQDLTRLLACSLQSEVDEYVLSVQERPGQRLKCPRVARRAGPCRESCAAAESLIYVMETVACVCRVGRNDKNPARTGCHVSQDSFWLLQAQIGKSRVSGEGVAGRVGFRTVSFSAGPSDVADRSGTLRPRRGEELDLAMERRVLVGPQGPCRRLQRKGTERSARSFGPTVLQEIWKIQPRPCEDPTAHTAGGQRPSGFATDKKQTCLS